MGHILLLNKMKTCRKSKTTAKKFDCAWLAHSLYTAKQHCESPYAL